MRITFEKVVRDRIPEIMDRAGVRYEVGTLEPGTFREALLAKVVEEAGDLREAQAVRRRDRDGFERRLVLRWTES